MTRSVNRYMSAKERFDAQFVPVTETGCWLWVGTLVKGYGQFQPSKDDGKQLAHRYSLEQKLGRKIAVGMLACHTCDVPSCVNPAHLYEGTVQSNSDDKVSRNRQSTGDHVKHRCIGQDHHSAKLTAEDVIKIRMSKDIPAELARRYGLSKTAILRVLNRITWKHVQQQKAT